MHGNMNVKKTQYCLHTAANTVYNFMSTCMR